MRLTLRISEVISSVMWQSLAAWPDNLYACRPPPSFSSLPLFQPSLALPYCYSFGASVSGPSREKKSDNSGSPLRHCQQRTFDRRTRWPFTPGVCETSSNANIRCHFAFLNTHHILPPAECQKHILWCQRSWKVHASIMDLFLNDIWKRACKFQS